ncbi:MAG TPA: ABC transporter permease [Puia sp.]|nr:ABC transporter permease [Puia sp.]
MLRNYFKIAIRNLLRNKGFSAINISGLAIGMASAMLILLWVQNQLTYDRWYPKTDRIYKIYNRDLIDGEMYAWPNTARPLAPAIKTFSAVEDVTRYDNRTFLLTVGDTHLNSQAAFVDSGFVRIFDFPMLSGDPVHALAAPRNIVITSHLAHALFGDDDPMGKAIRIDSNAYFKVAGVLRDLPANTSFKFDYLLPWSCAKTIAYDDDIWTNHSPFTFVLLRPGASQSAFDDQISRLAYAHTDHNDNYELFTQPIKRDYLYSRQENGKLVGDRIHLVQLFIIIAVFILLIACINFMNLSTARSERRAREVGIRKVVGAVKGYLIAQFIGESILIAVISFALALVITRLALDPFNLLIGKTLTIQYDNPATWAFAVGFVLFTGLLAGSYPAFYLSSFQPVKVLKGTFRKVNALVTTRKALVVLQFTFAIVLIIGTLIVERQIKYAEERNAGYDRRNLVYTLFQGDFAKHYQSIRQELLNSGAAVSVTATVSPMTQHWGDGWGYSWPGSTNADKKLDFVHLGCDADFLKTMGATLAAGREIDVYKYPTDSTAIMLNETAVKAMHVSNPIGLTIFASDPGTKAWHVIGVIKDFILESPFEKVTPMLIEGPSAPDGFGAMHVKLDPNRNPVAALAQARQIVRKYNPQYPADFTFVDENYAEKFAEEQQIGKLAALFAGLTIFISCLGLFALAAYMAENRIREIGIRKVLGASVTSLTTMLAKDFIWLVLVSFVIAVPIAWYAMNQWLGNYDYRVNIGWSVFALSGGLALLIAILTVSYQSIRAALANPVKNLRSE